MPAKRTVTVRQNWPSFGSPGFFSPFRKRLTATLPDWRLQSVGARVALAQAVRAMPATDFYTCRLTSLPMRAAGRSTTICIRPLAIRRSLVPGRPFCPAAASRHARVNFGRPDQSSTRRYRRLPCFVVSVLPCLCAKLVCLGKRSRLCRRATDEEYPGRRRTKGARRRRQPSPAPSLSLSARQSDFKPQVALPCA